MKLLLQLSLATALLGSCMALATDVTLDSRPAATGVVGGNLVPLTQSGTWKKWSVTDQIAFWNANLNFIPTGSITSGTWNSTAIAPTYGGTGLNTGAATGWPYVTAGTWSVTNTITSSNPITGPHHVGNSSAPTKAAGTGAGTSPTITLDSAANDLSGTITVLTGTSPSGSSATIVTLTFASAYATAPHVVLTPHTQTAAALSSTTSVWADSTTTTLVLKSGSAALTGATTYGWYYTVTQ